MVATLIAISLLAGCGRALEIQPKWSPPPDPYAEGAKARADFLRRPIVAEFAARGIALDCEPAVCAALAPESLAAARGRKQAFFDRRDRTHRGVRSRSRLSRRISERRLPARASRILAVNPARKQKKFSRGSAPLRSRRREFGVQFVFSGTRRAPSVPR